MTAPAARRDPTRAQQRPRLAPAALAGSIDLVAVEPGAEIACHDFDGESRPLGAGIDLAFDARRLAWHATAAAVTFVFGRPRIDGADAGAEQVDAALADDLQPWARVGGRFAIARIDLAAGEVLLATDRFGVWPLFWTRSGPRIAFSDRADCVAPEDGAAIDPQALFDYVYFHVVPAPRSAFRGVRRLEPASALRVSSIAVREQSTWRAAFGRPRGPTSATPAEFRDAVLASVLEEADERTGCFLSGGTDSSTVAGMLARARGDVQTFSIGFDAEGYDEMAYARVAARHFGTRHHEYYVTPDDLVRGVPLVAAHYDQPFGNSSAVPAYYCARMAGHHGSRRLLAGDGGDELFGGNLRYAKQKLFEAWHAVPAGLRAALQPALCAPACRAVPGLAKVASYVAQARVPMPARMETYNLLGRFGPAEVFTPEFLQQADAGAPAALQAGVYARSEGAAFVDRMLAYDWRFTLADNDLPKVTGTARLAGLDVGFPLLADRVVDLSLRVAAADKVRRLRLRPFFKEALADFLPPQIIAKRKHGFGLPVGPWLVTSPRFRALAYEALNGLAERRLIRRPLVDDLFSRRLEEHPGYYGEMVWILMMLELWMRSHAPSWSCR